MNWKVLKFFSAPKLQIPVGPEVSKLGRLLRQPSVSAELCV